MHRILCIESYAKYTMHRILYIDSIYIEHFPYIPYTKNIIDRIQCIEYYTEILYADYCMYKTEIAQTDTICIVL